MVTWSLRCRCGLRWLGSAETFADALTRAGWLDATPPGEAPPWLPACSQACRDERGKGKDAD